MVTYDQAKSYDSPRMYDFNLPTLPYPITDMLPDAEDIAKEWLLSMPAVVATLGVNRSGNVTVYLGMPKGAVPPPDPSTGLVTFKPFIDLGRSGGSPSDSEVPTDVARITFNCWAPNRPQAKAVAQALVAAALSLKGSIWTSSSGARIHGARVLLQLFQPDSGDSTTPRYLVDIALTITAA